MFRKNDYYNYFQQIKNLEFSMIKNVDDISGYLNEINSLKKNELLAILDIIKKDEVNHVRELDFILEAILNDNYSEISEMTEDKLVKIFKNYEQEHILNHFNQLSINDKKEFIENLQSINFDLVFLLYKNYISNISSPKKAPQDIKPAEIDLLPKTPKEFKKGKKLREIGEDMIKNGKLAVLIAAGGQGSRLGYPGLKGKFKISPTKGKSLFQLFAETIKAISKKYNAKISFILLTSKENRIETEEFFIENKYWDLNKEEVYVIEQNMLPTLTNNGKLILKDNTNMLTNPDGHGGALKAIYETGILDKLKNKGVTDIFYCQVDNPLVKILSPVFIGLHHSEEAQISIKVVRRKSCEEKVGLFVIANGKASMVEYSDLNETNACVYDEKGEMRDWAGNTGIHILSLDFIEKLNKGSFSLPYHCAVKNVEGLTELKTKVKMPGLKFETFIFDAISFADKTACLEVLREDEFSPIKNKDGTDSPETAQKDLINQYKRWLMDAGIDLPDYVKVEISPSFSLNKFDLKEKVKNLSIENDEDIYLE